MEAVVIGSISNIQTQTLSPVGRGVPGFNLLHTGAAAAVCVHHITPPVFEISTQVTRLNLKEPDLHRTSPSSACRPSR
ncbi:hypothetical protein AMELA_G00158640 [Ameiurus melas]|uniref:Uncharacterized protein n=1 Tax=Ameiurus melas TaxID=219545 RepID=A0A7J6AE95_AMEME|nr:hypothetical protein AMELA_G00158640 [Ameiurus melas]